MKSMTGINTNRQLNVEMDNTHDLLMKRKNKDRVVIVTTIQKLPKIMKTYDREDKKDSPTAKRLHGMCIVVNKCASKVSATIKEKCIDFPQIAIAYTVTENDENSIGNQQAMKESLADYNRMFDRSKGKHHVGYLYLHDDLHGTQIIRK